MSSCANCGKGEEESNNLKKCGACMSVKYCSAACQKAHRPQHKKECKKRAAELHDEALFKQPPLEEECPICFLRLPSLEKGIRYQSCCGKIMCCGCIHAGARVGDDQLCPFCRAPAPKSDEEMMEREKKRVEVGDAEGIYNIGCYYDEGIRGFPQDHAKALELWHRAGELGCAAAYYNVGQRMYYHGHGVERDKKKATHYYELAAIGGDATSRHNLGCDDGNAGNSHRALKHFMIAAGSGYHDSVKMVQQMYMNGISTKDDYAHALRAYQAYLSEIESDQRNEAAAYSEEYKYF